MALFDGWRRLPVGELLWEQTVEVISKRLNGLYLRIHPLELPSAHFLVARTFAQRALSADAILLRPVAEIVRLLLETDFDLPRM